MRSLHDETCAYNSAERESGEEGGVLLWQRGLSCTYHQHHARTQETNRLSSSSSFSLQLSSSPLLAVLASAVTTRLAIEWTGDLVESGGGKEEGRGRRPLQENFLALGPQCCALWLLVAAKGLRILKSCAN